MKYPSLITEFYETLKPRLSSYGPTKDYRIKPSSLGSKCLRKIYYDSWSVPKDFDVNEDVKKMGAMGDGFSEILSSKFRQRKILIDYYEPDGTLQKGFNGEPNLEFPIICPELGIKKKGYMDGVYIIDGKLWLGEYKGATGKSFAGLTQPKDEHIVQTILYLFVFNKLLKEGYYSHIKELDGFDRAEGMIYIYGDRDNMVKFPLKEFIITVEVGTPIFKQIVEKCMLLKSNLDSKTLPPKTPEWCNSCPFRVKCSKNYNIS